MTTPDLKTERIILRPPQVSDAEAVFGNWAADPEVVKYLRWNVHDSVDVTRDWLTREEKAADSAKSYQWVFVHRKTGEVFGSGGISYNDKHGMFELGYAVMKKCWNRGFATEAAKAIVDFAVGGLGQERLFACHAKENQASGRVLEKIGFIYRKNGQYESFDGKKVFNSWEYLYDVKVAADPLDKILSLDF